MTKNHITITTTLFSYRIQVKRKMMLANTTLCMMDYYAPFIESVYDQNNGMFVYINGYRFYDNLTETLYIPICDLCRLKTFLKNNHITYDIVELPVTQGLTVEIPLNTAFKPRNDLQEKAIEHLVKSTNHVRSLSLQTGAGKAQPLYSNIKTPDGWVKMKDVNVGDTILAVDGSTTTINSIHPQGNRDIYRLTLENGSKTDADISHLWKVVIDNHEEIVSTKYLIKSLNRSPYKPIYIPVYKKNQKFVVYKRLIKIKYVNRGLCQCISVDHPSHLYITDNNIITHNTFTVIQALSYLKKRTIVCMTSLGDQWAESILKFTKLEKEDIYFIQGLDSVKRLLENIDKTIFPKIIIANTPTLQSYATKSTVTEFNNFLDTLKVGIRVLDEAHLRFKTNLMMDLRFNPAITIPVTATFKRTNDVVDQIFQQHYSMFTRFGGEYYDKYILVKEYKYQLPPHILPKKGFCGFMHMYQHSIFEKWVLSNKNIKHRMFTQVHMKILNYNYLESKTTKGFKLLILFSTINMCEEFYKFLKTKTHNYNIVCAVRDVILLKIDDKYDIIISTIKKAGTAVDIPNLKVVYNTVSVNSVVENNQNLGRLRKLKDNSTPIYIYTYCTTDDKQTFHAKTRKHLFRKLAKEFETITLF